MTQLICYACKQPKNLSQFGKSKRSPLGVRGICNQCRHDREYVPMAEQKKASLRQRYADDPDYRERAKARGNTQYQQDKPRKKAQSRKSALKVKYGMTLEDYAAMVKAQNGVCAICNRNPNDVDARRNQLCIDHDHKTGKVRALLCNSCNVAIAHFQDDPVLLLRGMQYLLKFGAMYILPSLG